MMRARSRRLQRGFTLIEAIVVIVVLGVLATVVAVFIRAPVQAYADAVGRAEVTDGADLALRRMARDIRLALPNSIRVSADRAAVEFLLTSTGGRYLSAEDGIDDAPALDFVNPANPTALCPQPTGSCFTVLGGPPTFGSVKPGEYIVVNNLGPGMQPADAYRYGISDSNIAKIKSITQRVVPSLDPVNAFKVVTLEANPFALQSVPLPSPNQRFQVVTGPVAYYCAAQPDGSLALWRAWGYPIAQFQNVPPAGGRRALVATRLARCDIFNYSIGAAQRSGLVILGLELKARNERDPAIRLVHQVHVDNTP
jgi:MSHA biogenesis protein MshO